MNRHLASFGRNFRKEWPLHLMLLAPVVLLIIYKYIPMFGIIIAFENYKPGLGFFHSKWIGLENFQTLFTMAGFPQVIRNTIVIALAKIVTGIVVPVTFALLLNEMGNLRVKKAIQTVIYMPHFISWVLMASILLELLSQGGFFDQISSWFGRTDSATLLADKDSFPALVVITNIWKEFGYGTIIYLASLAGVNPDLYEAASIDGAGRWKQTLHVTLPGIAPIIVLMSVLSIGNILNAGFDQIFNLYSPVVYETGDIIDTFVYRMGFQSIQYGISTAASLFKSAISCVLIVFSYRIAYKTTGYRVF
jgi:putative aldouronate transport system permease protein